MGGLEAADNGALRNLMARAPARGVLVDSAASARIEELMLAAPTILRVDSLALLLRGGGAGLQLVCWSADRAAALVASAMIYGSPWATDIEAGRAGSVDDLTVGTDAAALRVCGARALLWEPISIDGDNAGVVIAADRFAHSWQHQRRRAVQAYVSVLRLTLGWAAQTVLLEPRSPWQLPHDWI